MASDGTVLFLCPHNAAKSLLAAAEFDRLALARGLPLRADTAGTEPDVGPAPAVVAALAAEGIDVSAHRPRRVTAADLANAVRVVSLGCGREALGFPVARLDQWDDVPAASRDLDAARAAIRRHVESLVADLSRDHGA
ncbi:MAG: phosphotyrosine protein phosphatase [Chloroflexia bacterium]|nr:phosphotyrosine protein phosphatase [Chloroflexia bacterium]